MQAENYFEIAKKNEWSYREILKDIVDNNHSFPEVVKRIIPKDIDLELSLKEIFEKYSSGEREGKFTIVNFSMKTEDYAVIVLKNFSNDSPLEATLGYEVDKNGSVNYRCLLGALVSG